MSMPAFNPPGPGAWELETAHFPRPFPKFGLEGVIRGFQRGFKEGTAKYGLLLSHFEIKLVNGFWYQQPAPFGAPAGSSPPPKPILWLLLRLHPAIRKRIKTSEEAFESKRWRRDLVEWDEVDKPAAVAKHKALLAEDVASMNDDELLGHLRKVEAHVEDMVYLHHKYTIPCCAPVGDLLAHTSDWTGKSGAEILGILRGTSKISLGFSAQELESLASAIHEDAAAKATLKGGDGGKATLDALLGHEGKVGEAARALFELIRYRALSYDIGERLPGEMPEMLVRSIQAAVDGKFNAAKSEAKAAVGKIREAVPTEHRARFDELVEEARTINRLRDERGMYADCLAVGIGRRALLEAGRRLVEKGRVADHGDAVDTTMRELEALFAGSSSAPSKDEISKRVEWRTTKTVADCPPFLGGEPGGPPDLSVLPPAARRGARAIDMVIGNLFKETEEHSTKAVVKGLSVNGGVYEGTARLIAGASEFGRIQQGDVLVTRSTAPYFNVVLPLLGAIVTDRGGQLCHAAIVAREYGIPGIVGTKRATELIPDGARVRVDGSAGEITVL